jgi:hypothetical protein
LLGSLFLYSLHPAHGYPYILTPLTTLCGFSCFSLFIEPTQAHRSMCRNAAVLSASGKEDNTVFSLPPASAGRSPSHLLL